MRRWLALAAFAHAVALLALPAPRAAVARLPAPESFDIDLLAAPPTPSLEPAPSSARSAALPVSVAARVAPVHRARGHEPAASSQEASVLTAPPAAGESTASPESWSIQLTRGPDRLARGQVPLGLGAGGPDDADSAPRTRTGGVAEALIEADIDRGLGRGGPVVVALEEVARTNDAPIRGVAVFEVTVDRSGNARVSLSHADAEADVWARLARAMSEDVAKKHVRIPDGDGGLRVTVELDARVQFPNGQDPRAIGGFVRTAGLEVAKDSMVVKSVPSVNVGAVGKVCSGALHVGVDGVALLGGCDPSNIGAVPVRIVHGRELREAAK